MDAVAAHGLEVQHPAVGAEYTFGSGKFTILSPKEISKESNANSVAIKLTNGENSFVFTGDADFNCEADMVNSGLDLSCDVLSVGHHGSATSTSWDFLQAAVPEFAVISCGAGNMYGHPHADTMEKLSDMGIQVYRSDEQGTIVASSDGSAITWSADPCNDYTSGDGETAGQSEGRMDLQLKIIAELMQLQHQKSQNRLLQQMTVRRKWYGYLLQEVNITVFLTVEI